ncbi:MAG TPA: hypothetical protein VKD71_06035 [Gemmataceae bacterium]|nr:hypothetical protein [Gemmataceae bacterium]
MVPTATTIDRETFVARLATAAYQVALRHGIKGSFAELELAMWRELRNLCDDAHPIIVGNS